MTAFSRILVGALIVFLSITGVVQASELEVPIIEYAEGDLDTCALGRVTGLKADGDGFLAVRTGPGTRYRKLDELHNHDRVWLFEQRGKWIGVVYGVADVNCSPIDKDRLLNKPGRKGWVHENWVEVIAG